MKITCIGEILIDLTQTGTDENGIPIFKANPGGAPANVAVCASRLGADTAFIGCVGRDQFGDQLKSVLIDNRVDADTLMTTDQASTTIALVTVDENGERSFTFLRKPGADTLIEPGKAAAAAVQADILHFGSVSLTDTTCRDTIMAAVRSAKESGTAITYDPNYRAALWPNEEYAIKTMRMPLPYCDIVKISDEETELMTGYKNPRAAAAELIRIMRNGADSPKLVLVTLGAEGALWRYGDREGTVPGISVKIADTNGAGDTFFGAVLSKIAARGGLADMTDDEIDSIVRFANKAASVTISRPGAIPAMPTLADLEV
ncbi:MAG: carbohydrate kinase [Eubacterium sp.]|nr:carbohydrate kinase [Eubacterium sp.]